MRVVCRLTVLVLLSTLTACTGISEKNRTALPSDDSPPPAPMMRSEDANRPSLEEILTRRRSVRSFEETLLTKEEILRLLWAAQGITSKDGLRTAPSAGALYPLELYVATPSGLFHYDPRQHSLNRLTRDDLRPTLFREALEQDAVREAPAVFVFTAVFARTEEKYGSRAKDYVYIEAGHAAQNLLLEAVALNLGAVPIGAFSNSGIQAALPIPADHTPLYLVPVGHARVPKDE